MPPLLALALITLVLLPATVRGQERRQPRREVPGLDFRPDGVWRKQARDVRATRSRLLAQRRFGDLNAPMAAAPALSAAAVSGVLKVPAVLFKYNDTTSTPFVAADYDAVLFGATPPLGRPYTYRSFYSQMSNALLDIQGQTFGYATLSGAEDAYNGGTSSACQQQNSFGTSNCNGVWSFAAFSAMQQGLVQALSALDTQLDFSQFSHDPTTGIVSLVLFIHPTIGGECGPGGTNNHLWAHRSFLSPGFVTNDPLPRGSGEFIKVSDYILQSGLGGESSCDGGQIMPIGTVAHETGHGFGLPDLYDTGGDTEGIGRWGLMATGNFSSPLSPARMEAWSLNELGWVTLAPLTAGGAYTFGPAPTSDTAFLVRPAGSNPRDEYFLLENRQRVESDSALIRRACEVWYRSSAPPPCDGGLLLWHIDGQQVAQGRSSNEVNSGPVHGVALVQADGRRNLDANPSTSCVGPGVGCSDRGDAGDPYPGTTNNTKYSFGTTPAALKNVDGDLVGFAVDSVVQIAPDGPMAFRLRFGGLTVARADDSIGARIRFDTVTYSVFRDMLDSGSTHLVEVADTQYATDNRTRYRFTSWSDGGPRAHAVTVGSRDTAFVATLARDRLLVFAAGRHGTVTVSPPEETSGSYVSEGTQVTLTATPDSGYAFGGWTGDTVASGSVLALQMTQPYNVAAAFDPPLSITSAPTRPNGTVGAFYTDTLRATGGNAFYSWTLVGGAVPAGLTLNAGTGMLSGYPRSTGTFSYQVRATSAAQQQTQTMTLTIAAPTLATQDVVTQLLGRGQLLDADQLRYLDFQGNSNGSFDVGDFLAWVRATGAPPAAPPAAAAPARQVRAGRP